jgi:hypothetical protein
LVGTLYVGCILLCTRYIWGAGVRFFPSGEGGGLRWTGRGGKTRMNVESIGAL